MEANTHTEHTCSENAKNINSAPNLYISDMLNKYMLIFFYVTKKHYLN